ncbi:hypothetical protein METBIDRAFT_30778 [Metschnikowia bicuspidata var. bicuspidata NRRL YB-4993]|uniref:Uncharacterized protein n=1 Tax=Metschnikowia bicuspidata var. bicuspidata NRRL YB-4993 TaxID=869754 RepID=A0A1A0HKW7_9ASCO|nr:hypothetical protein METBIDRAFT_30778 [Metschnikowia bicuspidata var. bicuspidata NRRL YB-4993]OBA24537.1 hypothetical protein METBIDRAFT_30778 [Metschnikowia bicuspidata var. bicuspidata NRRL YB-4993]
MLDPETFMKNSPFKVCNDVSYNLSNTTPELLKFQLQEQVRSQLQPQHILESLFAESSFNTHLQNIIQENSLFFEEDTDGNDEFLQDSEASGSLTPRSDLSDLSKTVADLKMYDYPNMRVLIENSVFDASQISSKSILSLSTLKDVKESIAEKTELKKYLEDKCLLSNQFCTTLLSAPESSRSELDSLLLLKVLKQISDLQLRLIKTSQELDDLNLQLNNHNLVCLISGYIEDVRISNMSRGSSFDMSSQSPRHDDVQSLRAFEALFSHIVSLAAQKNVSLPIFPSESDTVALQEKISWASECINALVAGASAPSSADTEEFEFTVVDDDSLIKDHSFLSATPQSTYKKATDLEKVLSEYKIALNDLRFSQEYFTKKYNYLKENSLKTILEYRKKKIYLEKELSRLQGRSSVPPENSKDSFKSKYTLKLKDQEILRLRKELNSLKIDVMGNKTIASSSAISPSLLSSLDNDLQEDHTLSSAASPTRLKMMSTAILRKEFKKIVEDIQDQYEVELEEERARLRGMELQLQQMGHER